MRYSKSFFTTIVTVLFFASVGWTASPTVGPKKSFGVRAGYGVNPDQIVFGVQAKMGKTLKVFRFVPSIDLGFGDNMKTYIFNGDFRFLSFSPPKSNAGFYGGVGAALAILDYNTIGSDTEVGLNVVSGITFPMGDKNEYKLELRLGIADMPDVRILFGINFGGASNTIVKK